MKVIDLSSMRLLKSSIEVICAKKSVKKPKKIVGKILAEEASINKNIFNLFPR